MIIVQADEGPTLRGDDRDQDDLQRYAIRAGILSAYYLPGVPAKEIHTSISPVNTFRLIMREYFSANVPLLEDRVFIYQHIFGTDEDQSKIRQFEFTDVTDMLPW